MGVVKTLLKELYGRVVKRRVQEFNVENRAFKLLDKGDLPRAPGHFTEEEALKKILKENPHLIEEIKKKNVKLVGNVGELKINVKYPEEPKSTKRKLPKDRQIIPKDTNFKVNEVPVGCIDFEMLLRIFDYKYNHRWTNEEIAEEFELDGKNVDDLIFYFKPFNNKITEKVEIGSSSSYLEDRSYIKIAQLLNRDVETFEKIPEYKREIQRIKEENKQLQDVEEEEEEESEEQEMERIENMQFKKEKYFLTEPSQTDAKDSGKTDEKTTDESSVEATNKLSDKATDKSSDKTNDKSTDKAKDKSSDKAKDKSNIKATDKTNDKSSDKKDEKIKKKNRPKVDKKE